VARLSETGRERILRFAHVAARFATPLRVLLDIVAWVAAATLAVLLRFDLTLPHASRTGLLKVIPIVAVLQLAGGWAIGLYRRRWRYGSYDEVAALAMTAAITTLGLYLLNKHYFEERPIPQSAVLVGGVFGLASMAAIRYVWRLILEKLRRPTEATAQKLLVYGAGEGGVQVITNLLRSRTSPYVPVGLLDDDPNKQRLSIMGVPVLGDRSAISAAQRRTGATTLLIAVPSASAKTVRDVAEIAVDSGLDVKVLPTVSELFGHAPGVGDIRDLTEADLLGRRQIETNLEQIAHYLSGKRVLVTGAGGSIGSELCRQIFRFAPAELQMLDRDESALHQVQLSIYGRALLDSPDTILCDIRDVAALAEVFRSRRPDVVFHAAALKHLPLLEQYPEEAYKSNVVGTLNVLRAAADVGVEVFVNISTDKAADPISVLGYSKRIAERLTAQVAAEVEHGTYLSVRFGNVLGSRGSVLTAFRDQIDRGGPVTVTDPDVTRYFMTVAEAVQLVIQAGGIGNSGEALVLDMGEPVRINDVARRLIAQSKKNVQIVYTGLRPGEKLHEILLGPDELDVRPKHPLISHASVPPLDPSALAVVDGDSRQWMFEHCTGPTAPR
jgi:FlaA1/EpsC-like NDP-sugar epimerase